MKKINISTVFRCAGAFAAGAIGSGFATGREILQFFTDYGINGIAGAVVTTVIFSFCGFAFLKDGYDVKTDGHSEAACLYFGKTAGRFFNWFLLAFQLCVYVIMITGAGAAFYESFGINALIGRIIMAALVFLCVMFGLNKLSCITGAISVVVILFAVITGVYGFTFGGELPHDGIAALPQKSGWLLAGVLYPAFNSIAVVNMGCSMGKNVSYRGEAVLGGLIGGLLFGLAVSCMNLGLLVNYESVANAQVPTLFIAYQIHPVYGVLYSCIILCGIFTTSTAMLWSFTVHFADETSKRFRLTAGIISAAAVVIGYTDFKTLIGTVYPVSGYFGLILIAAVILRQVKCVIYKIGIKKPEKK